MSITRSLLASDLDGTLIPLERDAKRLREVGDLIAAFEGAESLDLAYVTGRHLSLGLEGIAEVGLPLPRWFVCDVGTSVYQRTNGAFEVDEKYRSRMRDAFGGMSGSEVRAAIGQIDGLKVQEEERQAEFKASYYTEGRAERWFPLIESRLVAADVETNLVASHDPVSDRGLLDVLPAGIAKDCAVRYLHDASGVQEKNLVYAGDSGNDRAAMLAGYRTIVVGNADPALKDDLARVAAARGISDRIYFAEHVYARGVLEGLRHFGLLP
jgi:HAD superfamily hydrolase (TIGR01484 family)